jgi:DNA polymerase I-like protein with 3'-5' exonuclease and polymerase domains
MEAFLLKLLQSREKVVAHNMSFEANVIDIHFPKLRNLLYSKIDRNELICTKVYEQLLDNTRKKPLSRFSLADLVKSYFKKNIFESKKDPNSWRLRYSELDGVDLDDWPQEAKDYAIEDSVWAYKVYKEQQNIPIDISLTVAADIYLNKMAANGILIDKTRVFKLEKEIEEKLYPKYMHLVAKDLVSKDMLTGKIKKNMKEFRQYLSDNVSNIERTAKGNIATSTESLTRYLSEAEGDLKEVLEDFLYIMKYEKIQTAFINRLKEANPYIRTQYRAAVSSGRTSSFTSKAYPSVNMQQMPRKVEDVTWDIRNCFIPREGFKLCSIDYSGLELTSTAHQLYKLTGKTSMRDKINQGEQPVDMHSILAYRIMNIKEKSKETYSSFFANKKSRHTKIIDNWQNLLIWGSLEVLGLILCVLY